MVLTCTHISEIGLGEAALFLLLGERQILSPMARVTVYLFIWNIFPVESIVLLNLIFLIRNACCDEFCSKKYHNITI